MEKTKDAWEAQLACANVCARCGAELVEGDQRILSIYDHQPICMVCKSEEEKRADYEDSSKQMISECIKTEGKPYGDPRGYCFHHFCPYKCRA